MDSQALVLNFGFTVLLCGAVCGQQNCVKIPPGITTLRYKVGGDINIGLITFGRNFGTPTEPCMNAVSHASLVQASTSFTFAIDMINKDNTILPNITLGFTITDDCFHPQTGLVRTLGYIRPGTCDDANSDFPDYDVVAALGCSTSSPALIYGQILNLFRIPTIQSVSTAARLSDRESFNYIVRAVPSDNYQAQVILSILQKHNWTYISTISTSDDYGRDGIREVHKLAESNDICVAYNKELTPEGDDQFYDEIVNGLILKRKARVIVFFAQVTESVRLMRAMKRAGVGGDFVILASDGVAIGFDPTGLESVCVGALLILPYTVQVDAYKKYYNALTMAVNMNPWLKLAWSTNLDCTWNSSDSNREQCKTDVPIEGTVLESETFISPLMIDSVLAISQVIDDFITERCPQAFMRKELLKVCLRREELLHYLYRVKFRSTTGDVTGFDKYGDVDGKYQINQMVIDDGFAHSKSVGLWEKKTFKLSLNDDLDWQEKQQTYSDHGLPESVCAKPCKAGEFLIRQDIKCCWECERCRDNEVVTPDGLSCRECPVLTWPDQEDFLTCISIEPSFMQLKEPLTMVCIILSAFGLLVSITILVLMQKYRREKLIKATSKELSIISLFGVILSFITAILLIIRPSDAICYLTRFCFNLSFAFAYAPLFAKVARIYRIFSAGERGVMTVSFIGNRSQILFTVILISIQIILSIVSVIMDPPIVELRMPRPLEKFVEMLCYYPLAAILYSLTYNLILMLACTLLAFKARKLPENFNETRYIFVCVCTTLFLWIAFLPTYFTAFYASHKILLLVCILLMNSVVFLLCLYLPRLYAIIFVSVNKQGLVATIASEAQVAPKTANSEG